MNWLARTSTTTILLPLAMWLAGLGMGAALWGGHVWILILCMAGNIILFEIDDHFRWRRI